MSSRSAGQHQRRKDRYSVRISRRTHKAHRKRSDLLNETELFLQRISHIYGSNVYPFIAHPNYLHKLFEHKYWTFSHLQMVGILNQLFGSLPITKRFRFNADCKCDVRRTQCLSHSIVHMFQIVQKRVGNLNLNNFHCFKICLSCAYAIDVCDLAKLKLMTYIIEHNRALSQRFLISPEMQQIMHGSASSWLAFATYTHFKWMFWWNYQLYTQPALLQQTDIETDAEQVCNDPIKLLGARRMTQCASHRLFFAIQQILISNSDTALDLIFFTFDEMLQIPMEQVPYNSFKWDWDRLSSNQSDWKRYLWLEISNAWYGFDARLTTTTTQSGTCSARRVVPGDCGNSYLLDWNNVHYYHLYTYVILYRYIVYVYTKFDALDSAHAEIDGNIRTLYEEYVAFCIRCRMNFLETEIGIQVLYEYVDAIHSMAQWHVWDISVEIAMFAVGNFCAPHPQSAKFKSVRCCSLK